MIKSKLMGYCVLLTGFGVSALSCSQKTAQDSTDEFVYADERFADLQMLRYKVEGFEELTLRQKTFIYYLSEAALWGRDILFDQNCKYNLQVRDILEDIYQYSDDKESEEFRQMEVYLKRVWFSNGIHHHYGCEKFEPGFSEQWFRKQCELVNDGRACRATDIDLICKVIFDPQFLAKRVNLAKDQDLVLTSAMNYYDGVTQIEAEDFYNNMKSDYADSEHPVMFGMNSTLVKEDGRLFERKWVATSESDTNFYGRLLWHVVDNLAKARPYAEDEKQQKVIDKLISYYETGDLRTFDEYSILWLENTEPLVDFVNGFIECYGDPLGLKCSWESIVNFKDIDATKRTETLSSNAQWFEDNSPVDPQFRKAKVKGISAKVINAAMLGGDLYPSTAIGINLPNSDWVRREHGSKSVTIGNLTDAYNKAAGSGIRNEFVDTEEDIAMIEKYGDVTDDLHTDLHECLGHGSGRLLPGVDGDSLKAYGSTIEETRADLFGLYFVADRKLVELGLTPDPDAYKAQYYTYMMNGLMTQLVRIKLGDNIEEAHMRNRALIAHWCYEKGKAENVLELFKKEGKTYLRINDYEKLRALFGKLLAEIQRIKSTGDYAAAQNIVETYAVRIDPQLHKEILERYERLGLAPYKGFINPRYNVVKDANGNIIDVTIDYTESYADQMLRYGKDYGRMRTE
ncbi:MAG: dipeptidyl peptidase 3 [Bacteroidaceae bacterium]|nr:dipeptidyl peptidase 3 [Bacteroidaceae bacterium]